MSAMRQSVLEFVFAPSFQAEDFLVSASNQEAMRWIEEWPGVWPARALNLHGPAGCGKTHLAHIWAARAAAGWLTSAQALALPPQEAFAAHPAWVVEAPLLAGHETAWFHLLNVAREDGKWLLLTSRTPLSREPCALADLQSRLAALPAVGMQEPDDVLLESMLAKRFSDMQLKVPSAVLRYAVPRMERSFAAAEALVRTLATQSLAEKKNITLPWIKKFLETE